MWRSLDVDAWSEKRKGELKDVRKPVSEIIELVRAKGDTALIELTERFDKVKLDGIKVTKNEFDAAFDAVDDKFLMSLEETMLRVRRFHEMQLENQNWIKEVEPGITLGMRLSPLERIGAYIPGGKAAYPSTAMMCVVPAKVAGVKEIACCTPPPVSPLTLVALKVAGADEVYKLGGAQAIAALALGTKTIRPVQKIVGPGNVYVTEAKVLLRGLVEIDFPAGPSEIAIIADGFANPRFIAADILAQAEHDPNSPCILITTSQDLANQVGKELDSLVTKAKRKDILQKSMKNAGFVIVKNLLEGMDISNRIAPEHLSIQTKEPIELLGKVKNAGSIFLGPYSPVAAGDYATGTNHVLPTAGHAKLYSGLDVRHFCKASSVQMLTREGLQGIAKDVACIANAEGLQAHADSVYVRLKKSS